MATREPTPEQRDRKNQKARERRASPSLGMAQMEADAIAAAPIEIVVQVTAPDGPVQHLGIDLRKEGKRVYADSRVKTPAETIRSLMPWIDARFGRAAPRRIDFDDEPSVETDGPVKMPLKAKYKTGQEIKATVKTTA